MAVVVNRKIVVWNLIRTKKNGKMEMGPVVYQAARNHSSLSLPHSAVSTLEHTRINKRATLAYPWYVIHSLLLISHPLIFIYLCFIVRIYKTHIFIRVVVVLLSYRFLVWSIDLELDTKIYRLFDLLISVFALVSLWSILDYPPHAQICIIWTTYFNNNDKWSSG